jgi:hypothetical protein
MVYPRPGSPDRIIQKANLEVRTVMKRRALDIERYYRLTDEIVALLPRELAPAWESARANMTVASLDALARAERVRPGFVPLALELGFLGVVRHEEWLLRCIDVLEAKLGFMTPAQALADRENFLYDMYHEAFGHEPPAGKEYRRMPTCLMPEWKWRRDRDLTPHELLLLIQDLGYEDENLDPYLRAMLYDVAAEYVEAAGEIAIRREPFGYRQGIDYVLDVARKVRARMGQVKEEDYAALVYESTDMDRIVGDNEELREIALEVLDEEIRREGLDRVILSIYWRRNEAEMMRDAW